jgi:hypothetical protein
MAVYKRGRVWWYKFTWDGTPIRESTKQTNKRVAETDRSRAQNVSGQGRSWNPQKEAHPHGG